MKDQELTPDMVPVIKLAREKGGDVATRDVLDQVKTALSDGE